MTTTLPTLVQVLKSANERKLFMDQLTPEQYEQITTKDWLNILSRISDDLEYKYIIMRRAYWGENGAGAHPQLNIKKKTVVPMYIFGIDNRNEKQLQENWRSRQHIITRLLCFPPDLQKIYLVIENNTIKELVNPVHSISWNNYYNLDPSESVLISTQRLRLH